ncbi:MAG: DUF1835 domain-containing protein [Thermoflavifilum sp.]|nr:DUF1835 domain-containing protein [Thermoflavifilum sp.]
MERIIHIVFDQDSAQALQQAFEIDPTLRDDIVVLTDDYTYGPIVINIDQWNQRKTWLQTFIFPYNNSQPSDVLNEVEQRQKLHQRMHEEEDLHLWIWMTNHPKEVCGYFSLLPWIQNFDQRVESIFLHNLPFLNQHKQLFFPEQLSQIPANEYPKAKRLATPISREDMLADLELWQQLQTQNSLLRKVTSEKKCTSIAVDTYDQLLLKQCSTNWTRISKILQGVYQQKEYISADFLIWRLRELTQAHLLELQGEWHQKPLVRLFPHQEVENASSNINNEQTHMQTSSN